MEKKFINSILFFIISCSMFAANLTRDNYYVKVDGTGDGSSWENAMSAENFATALSTKSTLKSGVTFHLAAGTYHPMYDPYPEEHEGYQNVDLFNAFYVNTPINIIGGYSYDPTDGEVPNPSINSTILSGDVMEDNSEYNLNSNRGDDLYNIFVIDLKEKAQCNFSGITFAWTQGRRAADDGAFKMGGLAGFDATIGAILNLDKCTFKCLTGTFSTGSLAYDEVIVRNCSFVNSAGNLHYLNKAIAESCTFDNCVSMFSAKDLTIQNCTFYETPISLAARGNAIFHNNTVVINLTEGNISNSMSISNLDAAYDGTEAKISLIGNILDCPVSLSFDENSGSFVSLYNLYREVNDKLQDKISFDDDYVTTSLEEIFEKDWEDKPQLANNGGFTKTIKIISDKLPETNNSHSISIHFDRTNITNVTTDQRGVERFTKTCMGSYEKRDSSICAKSDTITVGGSLFEKTYNKIGVYKVSEVLTNVDGYDSVSLHTLYVLPSKDRHVFYVKTNGTGDGSSWDKAMSPEDFASRFYLSQTIDTFHLAAGTYYPIDLESTGNKVYYRTLPFALIGGYRKDITDENEKPDPTQYETILSVDFNKDNTYNNDNILTNIEDDEFVILSYGATKAGDILISGIIFDGGRGDRNCTTAQCQISDQYESDVYTFNQCEFRRARNRSIRCSAYSTQAKNNTLNINNCYFNRVGEYYFRYPVEYDVLNVNFNACTFEKFRSIYFYSFYTEQTVTYSNCTLYDCENIFFDASGSKLNFFNNTIYSSTKLRESYIGMSQIDIQSASNLYLTGNIIYANISSSLDLSSVHSSYNVYSEQSIDNLITETDIIVKDFSSFMDDEVSVVKNLFTPVLALKDDKLENDKLLRFPYEETGLEFDQRGVKRGTQSCMGSYELVRIDTVKNAENDTIKVGETFIVGDFVGKKYDKIGIYDSVAVVLKNSVGHDSVVLHTLYVIPTGNQTTFYVKTNGTGDGSSWDKAMSPEDFAWQLALSQSTDTFHVAAGTYYPIPTTSSTKHYERESPFCLIGGYPNGITDENQKPDPINNETIFSVDFKGDNTYDASGHRVITGDDDVQNIFDYSPLKDGACLVYGIVFEGGREGTYGNMEQFRIANLTYSDINFTFEKCTFREGYTSLFNYSAYVSVLFKDCYFYHIAGPLSFGGLDMSSCTFNDCMVAITSYKTVNISNCTMFDLYDFSLNVLENSQLNFYNNTVYSPSTEVTIVINNNIADDLYLKGNIIQGTIQYNEEKTSLIHSSYNLFSQDALDFKSETDLVTDDFSFLYDNKTVKEDGVFTPVLVLKNDVTSDGSSLRFLNDSEPKVEFDQRGVSRSSRTCMGSYELPKMDTIFFEKNDTIKVGETFIVDDYVGEKYDKIGVYDSVAVVYPDKVVLHTLYVIPTGEQTTFYVKTNGTGDGSSWDKAMSPEDFAWQLALSQSTDTFHVAAGTYYPIPTTSSTKHYERESPFCLIGGYPSGITDETQEPDPINNETIFSVDFKGDNTYDASGHRVITGDDDIQNIFEYASLKEGNCFISGIVFEGGREGTYGNMEQFRIAGVTGLNGTASKLIFEKCVFRNGNTSLFNYSTNNVSVSLKDCYFYHVSSPLTFGDLDISSCTLNDCYAGISARLGKSVNFSNCTMFNLYGIKLYVLENAQLNFYNNTVYSPSNQVTIEVDKDMVGDLYLKGNIIQGTIQYNEEKTSLIHSSYNLFSQDALAFKSETDLVTDDFSFLYDNKTVKEDGVFTPVLVLKNDVTSDGSSLRFLNDSDPKVEFDQRGVSRSSRTCMGSYELPKMDTIILDKKDTIKVGETFIVDDYVGEKYDKIGVYDSVAVVYPDKVVLHTLYVIPTGEQTTFYVKTNGKGDGSSWDEAMSPEDFAWQMELSQTTDTFHVAAGTYYPIITTGTEKFYRRNTPFRLIGGYPSNITDETQEPDPINNETILSVDFNGNNNFNDDKFDLENTDDDAFYVLTMGFQNQPDADVYISGIVFEGGKSGPLGKSYDCGKSESCAHEIVFDKCTFRKGYHNVIGGGESIIFNNCYFNQFGVPEFYVGNYVQYNSCTFEKIYYKLPFYTLDELLITNCTMFQCVPVSLDHKTDFINNTVYSPRNDVAVTLHAANLKGNIIQGTIQYNEETVSQINSSYNLFSQDALAFKSETDLVTDDFTFLFDNKTVKEDDVFTPLLALKSDTLSDGTSLRFPNDEQKVEFDQRGVTRTDMTCRGSYEAVCRNVEKHLNEIEYYSMDNQSEKNYNFETVGLHEYVETLESRCGADSVVYHKIYIAPSLQNTDYYVKENASGTGDGSSWKDAMNDTSFVYAFANAPSGATFHIAAGTYHPLMNYTIKDNVGEFHNDFYRTKAVNVIGGYRAEITDEKEEANPILYKTVLIADINGDGKDENKRIISINLEEESANCLFSGLAFEGGITTRMNLHGQLDLTSNHNDLNVTVEKCEFRNAVHGIFSIDSCTANINNCYFPKGHGFSLQTGDIKVNSCTFEGDNAIDFKVTPNSRLTIANSTIYNVDNFYLIPFSLSEIQFYNNTIYSENGIVNINPSENSKLILRGNLIKGELLYDQEYANTIQSKYNAYSNQESAIAFKSNQDILTDDFESFLDTKTTTEEDIFTPVLVLKNDVTSDGSSLRFPNDSVPEVNEDQRGVHRSPHTCMGSYELPKMDTIIRYNTDTIKVGETFIVDGFVGEKYDKIGIYDSVAVVYADSVVLHTVCVIPTGEQTTFYVKTNGKGDGSSWDEAMSPEDFAWQMALSQTTDTFHVAAGIYHPIKTTGTSNYYTRSTSFRLIGGYPRNITDETQEPDPINNETILSVDFNENNNFNDDNFDLENTDEDADNVLNLNFYNRTDADVYISGIVFEGGKSAPLGKSNNCGILKSCAHEIVFDKCAFRKGYRNVIGGGESLIFNNCYFYQYGVPLFNFGNYVQFNSCTFEKIYSKFFIYSNDELSFTNCTMFQCVPISNNLAYSNKIDFINNTVYSPSKEIAINFGNVVDFNLKGNIIQGAVQYNEETVSQIHSSYNIFSQDTFAFISATDLVTDDFTFLFDNKTVKEDDVFTPLLALKSDTLSDGTSLRFPNDEPKVEFDQRGVTRTDMTCRGSYEAVCRNVEKHLPGIEYYSMDNQSEHGYNIGSLGMHEIVEVKESFCGADSIVYHNVYIAPSLNKKEYYVKVDGKGDGSSWDNAMSDTSFAYLFANATQKGVTFYVAEGTYRPLMDFGGMYKRSNSVNVIGGYRADITDENEAANPIANKTILSGDLNNNGKADTDRIISIEADEASSCTFRGLVFDKCNMEGRYGFAGEIHLVSNKNDLNITVERCKFQDGYHGIFAVDTCTATINNCHFVDGLDFSFQQGDINVNSCTFESGNIYIISAYNSKVTMTNNAIYKIKKLNLITNDASELRLINNTVYSSTTDTISLSQNDNGGELYLYGNLFKGKLLVDKNYDYNKLHSAYNGYSASKDSIKFDSHEDLFKVDFSSLFINNGITTVDTLYVPILVLKQDSLPVDTSFISLRFPRNYDSMTQEVTYDQRGVKRPDMTCMGAYEAKCQSVEIYLTKTEYISKDNLSKYGMSFDTMGIHTYIDTLTCSCGADSLIYHTVYVVPSLKQKEYYVKVNGEGNGDGSSWENAMNDTSFAYLLTNAQSGATFYMAEGTYAPIFSMDGSTSSDKIFYTEKSFNIEGGYSKKSSNTSANKNPRKYVTEFVKSKDADINGVVLKINNSKKNEQSSIYGVTFQGKYRAQKECTDTMLYVSGEDAFSFKIEKCSFNESYYGVLSENIKLDVTGSEFKENRHSFVVRNDKTNDTVQVTATLFERNDFSVDASLNGVFVLLNSTFYKNDTFQLKPQASCLIYNNTVLYDLMNIQIKNKKYPLTLVGNIIMNMDTVGSIQNCQINTKSNLFQENSSFKTDRDFEVEDFKNILKCDEFSNYLLDEETNTVDMICDTLLNGQLLRYRRESLVLTDQRGVERNEMCCIGAYEMPFKSEPCETIVTEIEDTIHVGETYLNQLYDQVGRYVLDADTLTSLQGCDSIVIIRLEVLPEVVKPIPTAFTPYEKNGKNDIFMPGYEVYIYDVYGMVLTHSTNGWDGTVYDELVRPGIYVYAVIFDPSTIKKGTVEVLQEP